MSESRDNLEDVTRRALGLSVSEQAELLSRLESHLAGRLGFATTPQFVQGTKAAVLAAADMEPIVSPEAVSDLEAAIASGRRSGQGGVFDPAIPE